MLKKLSILSLLILYLPFFQTCSDKNSIEGKTLMIHSPLAEEENNNPKTVIDGKEFNLTFDELSLKKEKAIHDFIEIRKELTYNGYELFLQSIEDLKNQAWLSFSFVLLIIICCIQIILSFMEKYKAIFILGIIAICLLLLPFTLLYFAKILEDIEQLKIGFFLLLFNLTNIVFVSYSQFKRKNIS